MCPAPGTLLDPTESVRDKPRAIRRFFSRAIDLLLAWLLVTGLSAIFIPAVTNEPAALLWILTGAAWIPIEAALLSIWRTTPGKWLLRSRIESPTRLTFWAALDRSSTVFCWGLGCLIPGVSALCCGVGYQNLTHAETTRWDRGKFRVLHAELGWGRMLLAAACVLLLLIGYGYLRA
jgi:hypothetical protein